MFKEFLSSYPDWVVIGLYVVVLLISLLSMYFFLTKVVGSSSKSLNDLSEDLNKDVYPKHPTVDEVKILKDSKYSQKKASRHTKDVNRYGRWSLTLKSDNSVITRVGFLYTVLRNVPPVKSYREIK